jgi:hypothetical protein
MAPTIRSRHTVRRSGMNANGARLIEPWVFPEGTKHLAKLERAFFDALEAVDEVEDRKAEAVASKKFTDEGVLTDALQFAAAKLAPRLKRARQTVERAREELAAKREKLALKPADKADAAGQMRRLYKLDKFNALPDSERNSYVAKGDLDAELVQVLLEMPEYAKLLPSDLEQLRDRALRAQHGDEAVSELTDLETAVAIAEGAITACREEIAQDVGGAVKFNKAAEPHEKAVGGGLWLRKAVGVDGTEVAKVFKQVTPKEGRWVDATPEEIEAGHFYSNFEEWRAAGAEWPIAERKSHAA